MFVQKGCPRCNGDLLGSKWLDSIDLQCLQCGHEVTKAPKIVPTRATSRPTKHESRDGIHSHTVSLSTLPPSNGYTYLTRIPRE